MYDNFDKIVQPVRIYLFRFSQRGYFVIFMYLVSNNHDIIPTMKITGLRYIDI